MNASQGAGRGSIYIQNETLRRGFTSTPNRVLCNATLSMGARFVYTLLLSYAWQDDRCFPGQERLARDVGCSVRTVQRYLSELEETGEIQVIQQGLQRPNIYVILDRRTDTTAMSRQDTSHLSDQDTTAVSRSDPPPMTSADTTAITSTDTTAVAHNKKQLFRRKHREINPTGGWSSPGSGKQLDDALVTGEIAAQSSPAQDTGSTPRPDRSSRNPRSRRTISPAVHLPPNGHLSSQAPPDAIGATVSLLRAQGVSESKAAVLAARYPTQQIVQQIEWLAGRRYDDRAACLVAAIEGSYGPPSPRRRGSGGSGAMPSSLAGQQGSPAEDARSTARYTGGSYGVCPVCLASPCDADCPISSRR